MKQIILASASPRRKELLEQIGLTFRICPAVREEIITTKDPAEAVRSLSAQKAEEVWEKNIGEQDRLLVIGADTVVAYGSEILGKPGNRENAVRMLQMLQGREHQVYTGVTLIWNGSDGRKNVYTFHVVTSVALYPMSPEEIAAYVESGEPMDKAGAYGIQGRFAAFVRSVSGEYNNVVGLPVGRLYQELSAFDLLMLS